MLLLKNWHNPMICFLLMPFWEILKPLPSIERKASFDPYSYLFPWFFFLTFRFLGPDFPYFDSTYASHSTFYFLTPTDPWFSRETCQLLGSGEKKLKKKEKREGKGYWKRKTPLLHLFLFSHLLTLPPTMLPQKPCLFWFKSKLNLILATCIMGSVIRNYDRNYGCPWH